MLVIETKNLTRVYPTKGGDKLKVVDNVNLQVEEGQIFGFLGPNGAGKTTTIKMLLGIIYPTSGSAKIFSHDVDDIRIHRLLSYLPEKPYYYEHMTGMEVLCFYASLFGIRDRGLCQRLLEKVHLAHDAHRPLEQYSKGMQQRIGLAQCLLNDPKLLFLDEPTAGLDPIAHIEIRDLILQLRNEGKTIFISSHALSDVERICDYVAILNHGKIQKQGKLDELLKGEHTEITATRVKPECIDSLRSISGLKSSCQNDWLIIDVPSEEVNAVIDRLRLEQASIVSIIPRRKKLEDLFIETIKNPERQEEAKEAS
jgi:ABC-2 type transport system ATP-binding protein